MKIKSILSNEATPILMFFIGFFGYAVFIFYVLAQSKKGNIIIPNLVNFQIMISGITFVILKLTDYKYTSVKKTDHQECAKSSNEITLADVLLANIACVCGGILMALCPLIFIVR